MSEGKPTPGPWKSIGGSACYENIIGNEQPAEETFAFPYARPGEVAAEPVCRVHKHCRSDANKALIIAAPDLLTAAKSMLLRLNSLTTEEFINGYYHDAMSALAAAVQKAEGGER